MRRFPHGKHDDQIDTLAQLLARHRDRGGDDERGSVTAMVNGSTGAQTSANSYGPYGEPGSSNSGPFGHTGQPGGCP